MKKNIAIILAGGSGLRVGGDIPKQFMIVAGKPLLAHTLSVFQNNRNIDEMALVIHPVFTEEINQMIQQYHFTKITQILEGGAERYNSTLAALAAFREVECNFIIHDGVRPLVTDTIINENIAALQNFDACTTAIPVTDTLLQSDASKQWVAQIPDRSLFYQVQTPQAFNRHVLQKAYDIALKDSDFHSTDDCGVVRKYTPDIQIKIVNGSPSNLKLTYKEDIPVIEKLLQQKN